MAERTSAESGQCTGQSIVQKLIAPKWRRAEGVTALINNAGITIGGQSVVDISLDDWCKVADVNLHSVLYATRALPHM